MNYLLMDVVIAGDEKEVLCDLRRSLVTDSAGAENWTTACMNRIADAAKVSLRALS
jgi:hypothetical protein